MGSACARLLGRRYRLVLSDINEARLARSADALRADGYDIAGCVPGDLTDEIALARLTAAARAAGVLGALVHTAGLSPALAEWDQIIRTNLVATALLLDAFEPALGPGACAVLIASMAGHGAPRDPDLDAIADAPRAPDLLQRLQPYLQARTRPGDAFGLKTPAYSVSKRAVIRMAEARAVAWGARGARIVSISPGTIFTPMGRAENDVNPAAAAVVKATPVGRWGMPMDIASAVEFLVSDVAGFITGTDLRVDGGVMAALRGVTF
jgi:NAD(P)-dependent dehydrogenase (short-subunit alcohol dehydrogenase family)